MIISLLKISLWNLNLKILALITARKGSKRIPGKNVRSLGDKPLIMWSIDTIQGMPDICDVLVSTDDSAIADIGRMANVLVPWLRPKELSTDEASSVDVCLHAVNWYESEHDKLDGILLLQPTSPFRSKNKVHHGINLFRENNHQLPVIGVSHATTHPYWCYKDTNGGFKPYIVGGSGYRSQDLPSAYVLNGAFFLISPENLRKERTFLSDKMVPLIFDKPEESIDLDTEWDWMIAESFLQKQNVSSK